MNIKHLATLPKAQANAKLAKAVAWEFALPHIVNDLRKMAPLSGIVNDNGTANGALYVQGGKVISLQERDRNLMSEARIKAFLGRKYATPDANPILTGLVPQVTEFFHTNMPELDLAWQMFFDFIDLRGTNQSFFDLDNTSAGISWKQRKPGQKADIKSNISEDSTSVSYLEFATGIGILDAWLRYNKFWKIDEVVAEFRSTYWDQMAALHYGLLTALGGGVNQDFDTDDSVTFNAAASGIIRGARAKGYAVGTNVQFKIACAPEKTGRILKMLMAQQGSQIVEFGTLEEPIAYTVNGVAASTHIDSDDTGYYLVLPQRKMKSGQWQDLSIESDRDIAATAENIVGTGQYNAILGDSTQVKRVLFS
jgi:hypothetical protein